MIKCKLGAAAVVITPPNKLRMAAVKLPLPPLPNPIFIFFFYLISWSKKYTANYSVSGV